jgi:hypothetical protein
MCRIELLVCQCGKNLREQNSFECAKLRDSIGERKKERDRDKLCGEKDKRPIATIGV